MKPHAGSLAYCHPSLSSISVLYFSYVACAFRPSTDVLSKEIRWPMSDAASIPKARAFLEVRNSSRYLPNCLWRKLMTASRWPSAASAGFLRMSTFWATLVRYFEKSRCTYPNCFSKPSLICHILLYQTILAKCQSLSSLRKVMLLIPLSSNHMAYTPLPPGHLEFLPRLLPNTCGIWGSRIFWSANIPLCVISYWN